MNKILLCSFACLLFVCPVCGQQQPVAFTNTRIIHIVAAAIDRGTVVVQTGNITAMCSNVHAQSGAQVIAATGTTTSLALVTN